MHEPAVVDRAKALLRHVRQLGAEPAEFTFPVTPDEGFDLLGWWRQKAEAGSMDFEMYDRDVFQAARRGNPFPVLEHFKIFGFTIVPKTVTH
jgi:hypothetical protein